MINISIVQFFNAKDRNEAISLLVRALRKKENIKRGFKKAIFDREKLSSTAIGSGVALPHAKWQGKEDFVIALGIQKGMGIEWDAMDNVPVKIIFMIGGSDERQEEYLHILSYITNLMSDKNLRQQLINCTREEEVLDLLSNFSKK